MRTVSLRLADMQGATIPIGFEGENEYTQVRIDCKKVYSQHPDAVASLNVNDPVGNSYTVVPSIDDTIVVWNVTDSDLQSRGFGELQIVFTVDETVVGRSAVARTVIKRSVPGGGGSGGTRNYNDLENKPQINGTTLVGNKTLENLGIHNAPSGGSTNQVLAKNSAADYDFKWVNQSGGGGGTSDYNDLDNKPQIAGTTLSGNKSLHDLGIAAESAIPDVSGKADKVTGATSGNFASLDANGNLTDSGKKASDFATPSDIPDVSGFYTKPSGGIPSTDMASAVQTSLGKADSAYQKPGTGIPATDLASGVIPSIDSELSSSSTNPVQNKVITEQVNSLSETIDSMANGGEILSADVKTALLNLFDHVVFTDGSAETYINALISAWTPSGTLTDIDATFTQTGTVYNDDDLDTLRQYLVVKGTYSLNGTSYEVDVNGYTLSGTLSVGTSTITVAFGGFTDTFSVTVTQRSEYTFYTKLIATGQEYIDPNLTETDLDGCSFEYKIKPNTNQNSSGHVLSSQNNFVAFPQYNNSKRVILAKIAGGSQVVVGSEGTPAWVNDEDITIIAYGDQDKSVYANGTKVINSVTPGSSSSSGNKYALFGYGGGASTSYYRFRGGFYYLKIYNSSNELIHHFVPAMKVSTNKIGVYDEVTESFFSSATSTEFTAE